MNVKLRLVMLAASLVALPAGATILQLEKFPVEFDSPATTAGATSIRSKDQGRIHPTAMFEDREADDSWDALAQTIRPLNPFIFPSSPAPWLPPLPPFVRTKPAPRAACEEEVNRHYALAGYLKSKLRLSSEQRTVWAKIELAVEPAVDKLHALCDQFPGERGIPRTLPDVADAAEKLTTILVDLLRGVRGPIRELYDTLSTEQRSALSPHLALSAPCVL